MRGIQFAGGRELARATRSAPAAPEDEPRRPLVSCPFTFVLACLASWRFILASALVTLTGCRVPGTVSTPGVVGSGFPLTVTDDAGRRVVLAGPARRIVSLSPCHTETLFALGLGDRVVAAEAHSAYP